MNIIHRNNNGCLGGSSKTPTPTPYVAAPTPTAVTNINPVATASDRAKALQNFKYGLASTIKSPIGFTGSGTQLSAPSIQGTKKTLG